MQRQRYRCKAKRASAIAGLLALAALPAFAQTAGDTVSMAVKGTITPPACKLTYENGVDWGFGNIAHADLSPDAYRRFKALGILVFDVTCPTERSARFSLMDNQASTAISNADMYRALGSGVVAADVRGLGTVDVNGKPVSLGSYIIQAAAPLVDDGPRWLVKSADGGSTWDVGDSGGNLVTLGTGLYSAGSAGGTPTRGTTFTFMLEATVALNKSTELPATESIPLNGSTTLVMHYE